MSTSFVNTKESLEIAQKNNASEIVITGELASKIYKSKKVLKLGAAGMAVLTAALAAAPFTGGMSMAAAAPVAALTGVEIVAIIAAASIGLALIFAVYRDYEEVSYEEGKLVLKRKNKHSNDNR